MQKTFNLLKDIVYYFIELTKFNKTKDELNNVLDKWIYFLKKAGDLENIPESLNEKPFLQAFEKAQIINMDEDEYDYKTQKGLILKKT